MTEKRWKVQSLKLSLKLSFLLKKATTITQKDTLSEAKLSFRLQQVFGERFPKAKAAFGNKKKRKSEKKVKKEIKIKADGITVFGENGIDAI